MDMSDVEKALAFVLKKSGPSIDSFLETVFLFLKKRSDFYVENVEPAESGVGFKPGVAEKLVLRSFRKYRSRPQQQQQENVASSIVAESDVPPVANEETVACAPTNEVPQCEIANEATDTYYTAEAKSEKPSSGRPAGCVSDWSRGDGEEARTCAQDADTFNGSETSLYKWSQSQEDIEVKVQLDSSICHRSQLQVQISSCSLTLRLNTSTAPGEDQWEDFLKGEFMHRVNTGSSCWNFDARKHMLHIFVEKTQPKYWKRLLVGGEEQDLDMRTLDTTISLDELPKEEQATIDQLRYDQFCKMKGLPSIKDQKQQQLLQKAWNAAGSPFAGTPFTPSTVKFS